MKRVLAPVLAALGLLAIAALVSACGGTSSEASGSSGENGELTLVAFSTPQVAHEEIIPAFNETPEGEGVGFEQSYGSSGEQSRAVEQGLAGDVVHLSLEPDVTSLVDAGLVDEDWNRSKHDGMVTNSTVALMVRPGNPEDIQDWDDLTREGVEVINPNPITSGGARWNTMAAYGQVLEGGGSEEEARQYLSDLFANITVQDTSARDSLETFTSGQGDVLIGYEQEAILAQQQGEELDYVVPDDNILIENPGAVVNDSDDPEAAQAYLDFLVEPESQETFQQYGYRPVNERVVNEKQFPEPSGLFTIDDLGGWEEVSAEFFDEESGLVPEIQREAGAGG
jgi:sulfate/thiosulfate transport system substrate-binding protein